jgi:hypothetical protein
MPDSNQSRKWVKLDRTGKIYEFCDSGGLTRLRLPITLKLGSAGLCRQHEKTIFWEVVMMTRLCLLLVVVLAVPAMANEPTGLNDLGLGGLVEVSEEAGMEVRGMSSSAQATGLSAFAAIVYDPISSSQFNFNSNSFMQASDENAGVGPIALSTAGVETTVGLTAWDVTIGEFNASFTAALLFGAGQGAGASDFAISTPIFAPEIIAP